MSKQYGLIIPKKEKGHTVQNMVTKPSIFDDDSDSDSNTVAPVKPTGIGNSSLKKQDKINQERALEEDPTVYQYDEIYDAMDQKRKESKLARKDIDKKPKYISRLLQTAERRKRENERRIERQVQKEREAEGEQFKDKEAFVTTSYKKKLEEMKELEEQERREEYLESIGDVRKQGNLDGFYRHLYDQKVNFEDNLENSEGAKKDGSPSNKRKTEEENKEEEKVKESSENVKKRKYRQRRNTDSEQEDEENDNLEGDIKKEHLPCNLDADSDFSIESSDSEEENDKKAADKETVSEVNEGGEAIKSDNKINEENPTEKKDIKEEIVPMPDKKETKPKIDIWKKRTVGNVFDEALKRYFERKALRESGL